VGKTRTGRAGRRTQVPLLILAFVGFISLGLPDGLLGVAWPSIRRTFGTSLDSLGALLLLTTAGYLLSSITSGRIVGRFGVGLLLAMSGFVTAAGLFGYATAPAWWVMILLGLLVGIGAGAIDAGLNAYVAVNHSPRVLNWLHASFGLGATVGPLIMLAVFNLGQSWRWGYAVVGLLQLGLGACFLRTASRWQTTPRQPEQRASRSEPTPRLRETARLPLAWLGILVFFVYTGTEAAAGQWAYSLFTEARDVPASRASFWVSAYWGTFTVGRLVAGIFVNRVSAVRLVRVSIILVLGGAGLFWLNPSELLGFLGLALIGLACAPIFPSLIASTPRRIGPDHAANLIGFQIGAAGLGIALVPGLAGVLAERFGLEAFPPLLVVAAALLLLLHEAIVRRSP
jgi:fucose permease